MMKNRNVRTSKKKKVAIFVDGECEFWYFYMMKINELDLKFDLLPRLPRKKKLKDLFEEVNEASNYYDLVIWIVDLDKINEEERQKSKVGISPKESFKVFYEKLLKNENVKILVSNPCLEFWFLLHFESTAKFFNECNQALIQLKKYLKDYDKSEKYFIKNDIYKKLKAYQQTAVNNAKKMGEFDIEEFEVAVCEMYKLFDVGEDNIFSNLG